jgi:hypothetical protein
MLGKVVINRYVLVVISENHFCTSFNGTSIILFGAYLYSTLTWFNNIANIGL